MLKEHLEKIGLVFIVVIVIVITFFKQYNYFLNDIENTAKSMNTEINRYIDLSKGFIDLMAIYGNNYFEYGDVNDSELIDMINYNSDKDGFSLDTVKDTKYQNNTGNITGLGAVPESGIKRNEINLALRYNEQFSSVYKKLPEVAWLYYTSKNKFINMYPWISSSDFSFSNSLIDEKFFDIATPEKNPLRDSLWTPVYLDHAGKGLMVTLSSPVYNDDTFMGVVSLDITNEQLSSMIKSKYEIFIIDDTNSVIANSSNIAYDNVVPKLNELIKSPEYYIDNIKNLKSDNVELLGGSFIYSARFNNAPWIMLFRIPVWLIIGKAALYTLPVFVICLLFLYTYFEVVKRIKTESLLKTSLDELTSYQNLLENAAKYDFLTGTVNRRGFMDIFNTSSDIKAEVPTILIMCDIDYFKQFNDNFGHSAGDKVLVEIANLMMNNIKTSDVVCRWGGEEFLVMLLNQTYDEALIVAENIRREIEEMIVPWEKDTELRATITLGVSEYDYKDNFDNNISKADNTLYCGKSRGRNMVLGCKDC